MTIFLDDFEIVGRLVRRVGMDRPDLLQLKLNVGSPGHVGPRGRPGYRIRPRVYRRRLERRELDAPPMSTLTSGLARRAQLRQAAGMKAVFDTRVGSGYDDDVARKYHFPDRYLGAATQAVGDWIVYREPVRGKGKPGYTSVARLSRIEADPALRGHSYAWVTDYLPFDAVVPIRRAESYFETALNAVGTPSLIGRSLQGRSVRVIPDEDFGAIVRAGLGVTLDPANAVRLELDPAHIHGEALSLVEAPVHEQERRIAQMLMNRKIRDAAFRRAVVDAYDNKCAVTGLRIVNGGGKAEVQAAHIWPVSDGGPDTVQNGMALSATAHWCFDRHLITVTDDYRLLVSHNKVPADLRGLFARQLDGIHRPDDPKLWPHPAYLQRHRERFAEV